MRRRLHYTLLFFVSLWALPSAWACDGSGYVINDLIDNGDGTWTLEITVYVAGADWTGGILGGTRGFDFSTDAANILSVNPPTLTSLNGTTLNAVINGNTVSWGDPNSGPYFVEGFEPTQTFPVTLILSEEPTVWMGGGMENNGCPGGAGTSNPSPGYSGIFNNYNPPPLCESMPNAAISDLSTTTDDQVFLGGAASPLGSATTIDAVCLLIEHTYIGDLTISLTSPEGTTITLSQSNGGGTNNYGDPLAGSYMCFTTDALFSVNGYTGNSVGAYNPEDGFSAFDGENPNGNWTIDVFDGAFGDVGTLVSWGMAFSNGSCDCQAPTIDPPAVDPVCFGESVMLTANSVGATDISWSTGDTGESISYTPFGDEQITITASSDCGMVEAFIDISVVPQPTIEPIDDVTICNGEEVALSATAQHGEVIWSNGSNGNSTSYFPDQSEVLIATAFNDCGMVDEEINVTVIQDPEINALSPNTTICAGEVVLLDVFALDADAINWSDGQSGETIVVTPEETTTYIATAVNDCATDEVAIMITVLPEPTIEWVAGDQTICEGQSAFLEVSATDEDYIEWSNLSLGNSQEVSPTSTTTFTVTAINDCGEQTISAEITVLPPYESSTELFACEGSSITYDNINLFPGETETFVLTATDGCDSLVTVMVSPLSNSSETLLLQACPGDTITYDGSFLMAGDNQIFTFPNAVGCDSVVTVMVEEAPTFSSTLELFTCEGGFVLYQGTELLPGESMPFVLMAENGCDSTVTVSVTAQASPEYDLTLTVCPGDSITYENSVLGAGQSGSFLLQDIAGCDSTVHVMVEELPVFATDLELVACPGETATYANTSLAIGSIQEFSFTSENGCDSIVTVMVSELPTFSSDLEFMACEGNSVSYNNEQLMAGTTQDFTFIAANGCDSVVTVTVNSLSVFASALELSSCPGEAVIYEGVDLFPGDQQSFTLQALNGCDSVVTVSIAELPTFTSTLSLQTCEGVAVSYNGSSLPPGTTQDFTLTAANGCDSVVTVNVIQVDDIQFDLPLTACPGTSISYEGVDLFPGEGQSFLFSTAQGCDSTVNVSVSALPTFSSSATFMACPGETVTYDGIALATGSIQDFTLAAQNGCDSVVTVVIEELPTFSSNLDFALCPGESINYEGVDLSGGDQQTFTLSAENGCDSLVEVTVSTLAVFSSDVEFVICPDETVSYNGQELGVGTLQGFTFSAVNGCDSVVSVLVSALPTYSSDLELVACPGEAVAYAGSMLMPGEVQDFTLNALNGCDSIVTVMVSPLPTFNSTLELMACPGSSATYAGTAIPTGSVQDFTLTAVNGCDSVVTVMVSPLPTFSSDLELTACPGSSATYADTEIPAGSIQDFTLTASNGCDSVVTVMVSPLPTFSSDLELTACPGSSATYADTEIPAGSIQDFTLTASNGCDSVVTVMVSPLSTFSSDLELTVCDGSTLSYNNTILSAGDQQDFTFAAVNGCDSVVTVSVAPLPTYAQNLQVQACEGTSYNYLGTMVPAGSTQSFTLSTLAGCDSVITIMVEEVQHINTFADAQMCAGDSVLLFGVYQHSAGTYSQTTLSSQGCDSTHHISVSINSLPVPSFSAVPSCEDEPTGSISLHTTSGQSPYAYAWPNGGTGDFQTGLIPAAYTVTVTDALGCSQTLLTQVPAHSIELSATAIPISCYGEQDGQIIAQAPGEEVNFSLDGEQFFPTGAFGQLGPGQYTIYAQDEYGCIYETPSLLVEEPNDLIVVLPPDTTINLSENIHLPAQSNRPMDQLTYSWSPPDFLDCTDCDRPLSSPLQTTRYQVTVQDSSGCTAEDDILVIVDRRRSVYIPSGFSPNGDGINDIFYIFSDPSVKKINSFLIFNRWGEPVFEVYNSLPNDPKWGWDGIFRGQTMNPAVFAYFAEIEFIDGDVVLFKGDVSLVR